MGDMSNLNIMKDISQKTPSKIILIVIDGLGGLPHPATGKTELETAMTPNMDWLAGKGICGFSIPVGYGITPGSAPGHLALFGYDPIGCNIGRGVLEAMGIDFDLKPGDIAARGNFCTVDEKGIVTDRRAGRISSEMSAELTSLLDGKTIDNVQIIVRPVREHRFVAVFRGSELSPDVTDSDPERTGVTPQQVIPLNQSGTKLASVANQFIARSKNLLSEHHPANMVLLRGFSSHPHIPTLQEIYKLRAAAIAVYPMYRGLAKLVGMKIIETGPSLEDEFDALKFNYAHYDYFFLHIKWADTAGEDGDFERKVRILEQIDSLLPGLIALNPDVLIITGDHSTPAVLKGHSWHPVPLLLYSKYCRPDKMGEFSESACLAGGLGKIPASQIMPLAMANALKLTKFGA